MIFRFLLLSDEVDDFKREINIDAEATFADLHNEILKSVGYTSDQLCSFFICDDEWKKETEITLMEMDTRSDVDNYVMQDTLLEDLLEDERQKLLYVFDMISERCFFMELREIIAEKNLLKPNCTLSKGKAPAQLMVIEDFDSKTGSLSSQIDEDFYGDSAFNEDELDIHGYEGLDSIEGIMDNPYNDPY